MKNAQSGLQQSLMILERANSKVSTFTPANLLNSQASTDYCNVGGSGREGERQNAGPFSTHKS